MRTFWIALLMMLSFSVAGQALLLKSSAPPKPFIELLDAGALVSCASSGAQPPQPCDPTTGRAQLNNASASTTTYLLDSTYTIRRLNVTSVPQLGGTCSLGILIAGQQVLTGTGALWEGSITADRITVNDPTGSRCLIISLQIWAQQ